MSAMPALDLDAHDLALLAAECQAACTDSRVTDVWSPWPDAFVLELRQPGRTRALLVSAVPALARVQELTAPLPAPIPAPRFGQFLRARLAGRLAAIRPVAGERIVRVEFDTPADAGVPLAVLVLECFGAVPNLIALGPDGTIQEALHHRQTRTRRIAPGTPYVPLPAPLDRPEPSGQLEAARSAGHYPTFSATVDALLLSEEADAALAALRQGILTRLHEARRRFEGQRASLEEARAGTAGAERHRELGELLKANLPALRTGQSEARVQDFYQPDLPEVVIPLDPALPPLKNAERYFRRYQKARDGRATVERRLAQVASTLARIDAFESRAAAAADAAALAEIAAEAAVFRTRFSPRPPVAPTRARRSLPAADEPRRFVSRDGQTILVGTTARQNDVLTVRIANGHDTWLHVEDAAGAHVVIRTERGKSPSLETLLDAATLAIHHSKFRAAGRGAVTYTLRKYVSKPRHAPPGLVMVAQGKRLHVVVERERLERLMRGEEGRCSPPDSAPAESAS